jgi:uncharacterized membrane protein YccC
MKFLFRLLILVVGFMVVLGIVKFLFAKLLAFALFAAIIGVILYAAYSVLKTA